MIGEVVLSNDMTGKTLKQGDPLSFVIDTANANEREKNFLLSYYKPGIWMIFQISKNTFTGTTINTSVQEDSQFRITGTVVKIVTDQL